MIVEVAPSEGRRGSATYKILSLDGGGSKGVYTIGVLREVEALVGKPLCEYFDLVFGTSTGAIITALIGLGYKTEEIERLYLELIPAVMKHRTKRGRTKALEAAATRVFGDKTFSDLKIDTGIVATNYEFERPMVFKQSVRQAHGGKSTFEPGFGCTIADAVIASCAAFPFFRMRSLTTAKTGQVVVLDGGYVANNPTLFALADAKQALGISLADMAVLSVGVGSYNEPKRTFLHRAIFSLWPFRHMAKMFNISSKTIEQLRYLLFAEVATVRINETYAQAEYATDLLEYDPDKLRKLLSLGRESFAYHEKEIRDVFGLS